MSLCILILTNRVPYPLHDGGAMAMDAMIQGYHGAGWKVNVLAMNTSRHEVPREVLETLYTNIEGFDWVPVNNAVTKSGLLRNLVLSREPEHLERFRSRAFREKLTDLLQRIRPDVVQLESPFLGSYVEVVREFAPTAKLVYRMHNVEGQIWKRLADGASGLKRRYLDILAKRIFRYEQNLWKDMDLLLPITGTDAEIVRQAGVLTPLLVAPFGIHPSPGPKKLPNGDIKVYHIGAMDWLPNVDGIQWFLQKVWPEVQERAKGLFFHFAGRNMPTVLFRDLPSGAVCEGAVSDAAAFIRDKHILVVPLSSGGGIRIKVLEAMSEGKLVISTDIGMQGIEASDGLHYLKANTAGQFIDKICWADTHREEVATIAANGERLIREQYDATSIMNNVSRRVQELLPNSDNISSRSK